MALLSTKAMIQRATGGRYGARTASSRQGHNLQALAPLPAHSPGVLAAPLGELTVLYDVVTETVHVLNPSPGWCGRPATASPCSRTWPPPSSRQPARTRPWWPPIWGWACASSPTPAWWGAPPRPRATALFHAQVSGDDPSAAVYAVLDEGVQIRCSDRALLAEIDDLMASLRSSGRAATIDLSVETADNASVLAGHGTERRYQSRASFLEALPTVLNQIAAASTTCVALHAGCVRSPTGEVVLLPAVSGSGKTTLTAALVQAGWAYGTDEAVGLRAGTLDAVTYPKPLVLDATSRTALGLGASTSVNTGPAALRPTWRCWSARPDRSIAWCSPATKRAQRCRCRNRSNPGRP